MKKVKNTIPVYDICTIGGAGHTLPHLIVEPFSSYLQKHPNLHAPHRHSFYHLVFFTAGKGYHTIDFERFEVQKGQVYFMIPGQVHSWSFSGQVDGYIVNFSADLFHPILNKETWLEQFSFMKGIATDSVLQLKGDAYTEVLSLLQRTEREVNGRKPYAADMICAGLMQLFITVQRHSGTSALQHAGQNQVVLSGFRKLIDTWYAEKRLPKDYASMLYITPNHLNALCKSLLGKPAGELIRDRILLEAKRLLVNADKSIADISYELNFTDNSHFTRFFKKHTQLTPEEFRKISII